ncbi:MAG: cellulose biosynthesis cyclic di-GMP-binding regulatory protein BcsB [Sulfurovum sp.]|nr:cellulose biosynthesis cyclic di-GMP-binding regulatory protein BcsB [Sulfurovum sp.]
MKYFIYKFILFFSIIITLEASTYKAIEKFDNGDGTERIRIYLNYNNQHLHTKRLGGDDGRFNINLPIPDKWELLDVSGYIKYTSSLLMLDEHSSATILLNDVVIDQFKLF